MLKELFLLLITTRLVFSNDNTLNITKRSDHRGTAKVITAHGLGILGQLALNKLSGKYVLKSFISQKCIMRITNTFFQ
jgi:hypothetical protein